MSGVIHRKDLERIKYWLGNVLGLPPGMGDTFFVASSGSAYEAWFKKMGIDGGHLFTTPALGYAAMTTLRNDILCVAPEVFTTTAALTWAKSNCHMVGLGGPNIQGRKSTTGTFPTMPGGACMFTDTVDVVSTLHVTGARNQFHNMQIVNWGIDVHNLQAVRVGGTANLSFGNYFKKCNIQGIGNTTQSNAIASSLTIGAGASYYQFDECIIGHNTYGGARATVNQGHLFYAGSVEEGLGAGYGPQNGQFNDTLFLSRGSTATVPMVTIGSEAGDGEALDRVHDFTRCRFENWYGAVTNLSYVFKMICNSYYIVNLHDCHAEGYDYWRVVAGGEPGGRLWASMPITGLGGGLTREPTSAVGY